MRIKGIGSVIVILGQALYKNDTTGSITMLPSHSSRVEKGYDVYKDLDDSNNTRIIVTGGDTKQYNITEASIMRKKLISLHEECTGSTSIDKLIMLEEHASNTVENAINCYEMIKSNNDFDNCTIHIVSNEYHVPRVRCIFKCVFDNPHQCYKLCYHSADSRLKRTGLYRQSDKREGHPDINWLLCERLDWEYNAILTLNDYLKKYKLNAHISDISDALNKLRTLNETLKQHII